MTTRQTLILAAYLDLSSADYGLFLLDAYKSSGDEWVEEAQLAMRRVGLALIEVERQLNASRREEWLDGFLARHPEYADDPRAQHGDRPDLDDAQHEVAARSAEMDEFEALMVRRFADENRLRRLARIEARAHKQSRADLFASCSEASLLPQ